MTKHSRRPRQRYPKTPALGPLRSRISRRATVHRRSSAELDAAFGALGDPTRRGIIEQLANGPLSVTEIAQPFTISLPAISKHLRVLEDAGLISREREGRVLRCRLNTAPLTDAANWITQYKLLWEKHLDEFTEYVRVHNKEPAKP